jgi:16S rRNA processing protein RimM
MSNRHPRRPDAAGSASGSPGAADWVAIGEVVGSFGVRGELKIVPLTDFPDRFTRTPTVYLGEDYRPYQVQRAHPHKQHILLTLAGVEDRDAAERLRGLRVWVPASELTPLAADQFYLHDLIGLRVRHVDGRDLGVIADVIVTPGTDLFLIRGTPNGQDVLLPAVKAFVKAVDLAAGMVLVDPIPGLFDDAAEEAR